MSIQQALASTLVSRGLTPKAAAGVIGNAYQESALNPGSVGDGGGGLWGFTSGAISLGSLQSYAQSKGQHWTSPQLQANFLMDHVTPGDIHALNSQPTARAAAAWFMNNWERPYVPTENAARRMDGAEQTFKMIAGNPGQMKQTAQQRATGGTGTNISSSTVTDPGVTTKTTSGGGLDAKSAVLNALLTPTPINTATGTPAASSGLLSKIMANVNSGAYTTPVTNTVTKSGSESSTLKTIAQTKMGQSAITGKAVADAQQGGANADAMKLLHMLHNVNGSSYNQGNHDDINERDVNIKSAGTDCSGLISWLMGPHGLGIWSASLATPSINTAPGMQAGKGKSVTVWNNDQAGNAGHVFIQIGNGPHAQFWASEGGVGIHQLPPAEAQNYIQNGSDGGTYQPLHPKGL